MIEQCDSPLAMRVALRGDIALNTIKVLLTNLEDNDLGDDILMRLAKRRLVSINSWQIVKSLFGAKDVDPRLTQESWIAEILLELAPPRGYPPVAGGFLDAETVWPILSNLILNLPADRPDLAELLRWSTELANVERYRSTTPTFRTAFTNWTKATAGGASEVVLRCIESGAGPDAVPVGLAAGVVFSSEAKGRLDKAVGRIEERFFGGMSVGQAMIDKWNAAATDVVKIQITDSKARQRLLAQADEILKEVQAEAFAYLSIVSPLGFNQRLSKFGRVLGNTLAGGTISSVEALVEAQRAIQEHDLASRERRRCERIEMALRLVRWLKIQGENAPVIKSFAEAADYQLAVGGFVDWARLSLRAGDPVRELSDAYLGLFDRVTDIREAQARSFAQLLGDWTASGSKGEEVIPVERILEKIVAPLGHQGPVLVIVVDGMSAAVYRELLADIIRQDWASLCTKGRRSTQPGISAIPSVTEVSRVSLLCGNLQQGTSNDEANGFSKHPALLACSKNGYPPVLFHKASVQGREDGDLAKGIREEIASPTRRIVGVVINAVDDHLLKGEQLDIRWSRDEIKALPMLLHEAKGAGRLVVMLSDHGHVLDQGTLARMGELGERWRLDNGKPEPDELRIEGRRVMLTEGKSLIAPWSEKVRYGPKKNGYHGGITPQEMVVPVAVLSSSDSEPEGWIEMPIETPYWWDDAVGKVEFVELPAPKTKDVQPDLLPPFFDRDWHEVSSDGPTAISKKPTARWIKSLMASPVMAQQRKLCGRALSADIDMEKFLVALDSRGGKMTTAALARALDYPQFRIGGLLAIMQRALNIDGYPVLGRDQASDSVELNQNLLCTQFGLSEEK